MIPTIFELGPIPFHSFGFMLVLSFFASWRRMWISFKNGGERPELAEPVVFWAAVGGLIGARVLSLLSNPEGFINDPIGAVFSSAGFVFYGGFIGGIIAVGILLKREGVSYLRYFDLAGPGLAVGYAIGRIGCQLSGDGDYGTVTSLPWAMGYPLGVVPTEVGLLVHPAPVYETLLALAIAWLLVYLQDNNKLSGLGQLTGLYFICMAVERFIVEFVRIEPIVLGPLTQAQVTAIVIFIVGTWLMFSNIQNDHSK